MTRPAAIKYYALVNAAPLITVIMPTYNRSNVLPYSIGSVLAQKRSDFELLVIGDGCTDDSQAVVEAIGDSRVRWIGLTQNSGHQSVPNNIGLAKAQGDYIAYLGHDDLWLPHHLAMCVEVIERGSDFAYGLCLNAAEDSSGNLLGPVPLPYEPGKWLSPSSVVHRKSVTDSVGNWKHYTDTKIFPEEDLWQRISLAGYQMSLVPRLSVVKIPAAQRKDVYKSRDTSEQALWQKRMQDDPGFEAAEIAQCYINLRSLSPGQLGRIPYKVVLRYLLHETSLRVRRRLRKPFFRRQPKVEEFRQYKGLRPKP